MYDAPHLVFSMIRTMLTAAMAERRSGVNPLTAEYEAVLTVVGPMRAALGRRPVAVGDLQAAGPHYPYLPEYADALVAAATHLVLGADGFPEGGGVRRVLYSDLVSFRPAGEAPRGEHSSTHAAWFRGLLSHLSCRAMQHGSGVRLRTSPGLEPAVWSRVLGLCGGDVGSEPEPVVQALVAGTLADLFSVSGIVLLAQHGGTLSVLKATGDGLDQIRVFYYSGDHTGSPPCGFLGAGSLADSLVPDGRGDLPLSAGPVGRDDLGYYFAAPAAALAAARFLDQKLEVRDAVAARLRQDFSYFVGAANTEPTRESVHAAAVHSLKEVLGVGVEEPPTPAVQDPSEAEPAAD